MNPWALVILGIGVLLIIMGVKGSYGGVIGALTGKTYTGGTSAGGGGSTSKPGKGPLNPSRPGLLPSGLPVGGGHAG